MPVDNMYPYGNWNGGSGQSRDRAFVHRIYEFLMAEINRARREAYNKDMYSYGTVGGSITGYSRAHMQANENDYTIDVSPMMREIEGYLGLAPTQVPGLTRPEPIEAPVLDIVVKSGREVWFRGTQDEWAQTYFEDPTRESIEAFCRDNNWTCEITEAI